MDGWIYDRQKTQYFLLLSHSNLYTWITNSIPWVSRAFSRSSCFWSSTALMKHHVPKDIYFGTLMSPIVDSKFSIFSEPWHFFSIRVQIPSKNFRYFSFQTIHSDTNVKLTKKMQVFLTSYPFLHLFRSSGQLYDLNSSTSGTSLRIPSTANSSSCMFDRLLTSPFDFDSSTLHCKKIRIEMRTEWYVYYL